MTGRALALMLAGLLALGCIGFGAGLLVTEVFEGFFMDRIDRPAIDWLAEHRTPFWNTFMRAATHLGAGAVLTGLTVAASLLAYRSTREVRWSAFILFSGVGGTVIDKVLKPLVGRPRPDFDRLIDIGGNSFPSGHATGITGLWLALALFLYLREPRRGSAWIWPVAGAVIAVVLISRPYLGVHYPTDVVAGAALSAAWVALCLRSFGPTEE